MLESRPHLDTASSTARLSPSPLWNHVSSFENFQSLSVKLVFCAAPTGPPLNFVIEVSGTTLDLSWEQPAEELRSGLIRFYTLVCFLDGAGQRGFDLNDVTLLSLDDFRVNTQYSCTLSASTSGGPGPTTSATVTTDSGM